MFGFGCEQQTKVCLIYAKRNIDWKTRAPRRIRRRINHLQKGLTRKSRRLSQQKGPIGEDLPHTAHDPGHVG